MARMFLLLAGLWVGISVVMFGMTRLNNLPAIPEKILAEAFYYSAIAFAVYHLATRNKRARPKDDEPPPQPQEELSGIHAQAVLPEAEEQRR